MSDQSPAKVAPLAPGLELDEPQSEELPYIILPIITQAQEAFQKALPRLLGECPGLWVVFYGDKEIHIAKTKLEAYRECIARGYPRGHFLVRMVSPPLAEATIGLREYL